MQKFLGTIAFVVSMVLAGMSLFKINKLCILCLITYFLYLVISMIAFGAKPRPIIIIIGPITTGGKILCIHSLPISLMMIENITYIV